MQNNKPFAPACERNKAPILSVLKNYLLPEDKVLEVGTNTAQHLIYFAQNLPEVRFTPSDVIQNQHGINLWLTEAKLENIEEAKIYEIGANPIPITDHNIIYCANVVHIISKDLVVKLITDIAEAKKSLCLIFYGPFNYDGKFTSPSNQEFDLWLKSRDPESGIRDYEWFESLLKSAGFTLLKDHSMPANNRLLLFHNLAKNPVAH